MLSQADADALIAMRKFFAQQNAITLLPGTDTSHELIGENEREHFLLDVWRGTIRLSKFKFQERAKKVVVLVRLDIDGSPHTNPDGTTLGGTHIHMYREGYEDKWAVPLDRRNFGNPSDILRTFTEFCRFCNIENVPPIQEGLL